MEDGRSSSFQFNGRWCRNWFTAAVVLERSSSQTTPGMYNMLCRVHIGCTADLPDCVRLTF